MDEIKLLFDNAFDKLDSGRILFENGKYADAISRLYYAMFYAAKALLFEKNIKPKTHREVMSQFGLELVKKGDFSRELYNFFSNSQNDRENADYGMIDSSTKESTYKTLVATEKFINECLIRSKTLK